MFRKVVIAGVAALAITGCTQREQTGGLLGGAGGALVGAAVTGDVEGAIIGGVAGAAAGAIIGGVTDRPGYCYARDGYGRTVVVECPPGY